MAYCPECKGEIADRAVVCPHCGYDFPPKEGDAAPRKVGFANSTWGDLALALGSVTAACACLGYAGYSVIMTIQRELFQGLVVGPMNFFLYLAMLVVFLRVDKRPGH
jgi:hypothetical protein